ncbi:MAG TPA: hypothetical protein VGG39_17090 [Polyangiaceae bacterium]|jgi:hypothetical protein
MLLPAMTTEEIRRRVREAEALLRVAAQHARDAHDDPSKSEHASARIQSICREVEGLFPGVGDPAPPDPEVQAAIESLTSALPQAEAVVEAAAQEEEEGAGAGAGAEEDTEGESAQEFDVDYVKLGAAIENEELMGHFPEPQRSAFKRAARYLVESHERQQLFGRVVAAFQTLSELTEQNIEDTRKKLAMAMTLEELANKRKA